MPSPAVLSSVPGDAPRLGAGPSRRDLVARRAGRRRWASVRGGTPTGAGAARPRLPRCSRSGCVGERPGGQRDAAARDRADQERGLAALARPARRTQRAARQRGVLRQRVEADQPGARRPGRGHVGRVDDRGRGLGQRSLGDVAGHAELAGGVRRGRDRRGRRAAAPGAGRRGRPGEGVEHGLVLRRTGPWLRCQIAGACAGAARAARRAGGPSPAGSSSRETLRQCCQAADVGVAHRGPGRREVAGQGEAPGAAPRRGSTGRRSRSSPRRCIGSPHGSSSGVARAGGSPGREGRSHPRYGRPQARSNRRGSPRWRSRWPRMVRDD